MNIFQELKMGKDINEEKIIAILYANFRGKRKKVHDWIYLAKLMNKLSKHYGSYSELAKKLGLNPETVRETLKLLELPKEVQEMVKEGKLKHEVAWRIESIKNREAQIKVAEAVRDLDAHNARDIVRIYRKNPEIDIEEYVRNFKSSRLQIEKINLMILPIKKEDYLKIKQRADNFKESPEKFIVDRVILPWLENKK